MRVGRLWLIVKFNHGVLWLVVGAVFLTGLLASMLTSLGYARSSGRTVARVTWTKPTLITGHGALGPEVVMTAKGDSFVVWLQRGGSDGRLMARFRPASGAIGPIQTISSPAKGNSVSGNYRVVIDRQGNAVIVWSIFKSPGGYYERTRFRSGRLGPIQRLADLSDPNAFASDIAMDPNGRATIISSTSNTEPQTIFAQRIEPNGALDPSTTVAVYSWPKGTEGGVFGGQIGGFDRNGNAVVSWEEPFNCTCGQQIWARTLFSNDTLGPAIAVSPLRTLIQEYAMVSAPNGQAAFVWSNAASLKSGKNGIATGLQARFLTTGGGLTPIRTIRSYVFGDAFPLAERVIGLANGSAVVAWYPTIGHRNVLRERTVSPSGLGPEQDVASTKCDGCLLQAALASSGSRAFVAWLPTANYARSSSQVGLQARYIPSAGRLGPVRTLEPLGRVDVASTVSVAAAPNGQAVIVFDSSHGLEITAGRAS
jgi:hypothetical protein